jgi:hypothetical protein
MWLGADGSYGREAPRKGGCEVLRLVWESLAGQHRASGVHGDVVANGQGAPSGAGPPRGNPDGGGTGTRGVRP